MSGRRVTEHLAITNRWRTRRKIGRTVYVQLGPESSDEDILIGMMDTPVLAAEAVDAHNAGGGWKA